MIHQSNFAGNIGYDKPSYQMNYLRRQTLNGSVAQGVAQGAVRAALVAIGLALVQSPAVARDASPSITIEWPGNVISIAPPATRWATPGPASPPPPAAPTRPYRQQ
jgi:hypothetical protein